MKRNRLFKATFALVVPAAMVLTSISAAQNLTEAIGMVNASQRNIHDAAYIEAVRSIQTHGDLLHEKVGTILDYERARMCLENLELQPTTSSAGQLNLESTTQDPLGSRGETAIANDL